MRTAHTLLAQALAAYDAADANWKPAEWLESVRVYLATPVDQRPAPDYPLMRAAFQTSESGNGSYKAVFQFPTLQCMQAAVMQWHGVQKPLPSPAWCASVDVELAATAEADAVGMPWPTKSQTLYLEIAHATIACGEPAKVYAALGAVSLEKIASIEEQFNEMNADDIFNQGEGIYLVSVDWEEAQYEDGRMVFLGYWEIEVIDFQSFDELEKADAATTLPAAAVAEGAQLDGERLEQGE